MSNIYADVVGNPISRTDPLGLACSGLGCWATPTEQTYANIGNYSLNYQAACSGGDMYACAAGRVTANQSWRPNLTSRILREDLRRTARQIGKVMSEWKTFALAKAHADVLGAETPQNPIRITADQIADFHHDVFSQHYGGRYLIFG